MVPVQDPYDHWKSQLNMARVKSPIIEALMKNPEISSDPNRLDQHVQSAFRQLKKAADDLEQRLADSVNSDSVRPQIYRSLAGPLSAAIEADGVSVDPEQLANTLEQAFEGQLEDREYPEGYHGVRRQLATSRAVARQTTIIQAVQEYESLVELMANGRSARGMMGSIRKELVGRASDMTHSTIGDTDDEEIRTTVYTSHVGTLGRILEQTLRTEYHGMLEDFHEFGADEQEQYQNMLNGNDGAFPEENWFPLLDATRPKMDWVQNELMEIPDSLQPEQMDPDSVNPRES